MDYSPKTKIKKSENEIIKGLNSLKRKGAKEVKNEKEISEVPLNNIELNLQNFISKALVENSNETKYFNINQELEEIEKIKNNKIKEEESFSKLRPKFPLGEDLITLSLDENLNSSHNLIGLNHFKQKNKISGLKSSYQNNNSQVNHISSTLSQRHTFDFSENNIDNIIKGKLKKRNSLIKYNNNNNIDNKYSRHNSINYLTNSSASSNLNIDLYSPSNNNKNKFGLKKKLSHNLKNWKKGKSNEKIIFRRKQREKSQIINKKNLFLNLIFKNKENERKKISDPNVSKENDKFIRIHSYIPHSNNYLSELTLSENEKIKDNDIRNILFLNEKKYNEFTKCCESIKEKILNSPKKRNTLTKRTKTISSLKITENNINEYSLEKKENNEKKDLLSLIEKKKYLEEGINISEIGSNRFNVKEFKELQYRHLIRLNKLVYDSLSDEESDFDYEDSFYLDPKSTFKLYFDSIIFFITIFNMIFPPLKLCFKPKNLNYIHSKDFIINIIINIFYLFDLFLGFITAYYDIEERFIIKLPNIIFNYLTSWFIPDLISSFPYSIISLFKISKNYTTSINEYKVIYLLELFTLIKSFKIYKNNTFFFNFTHFLMKKTSLYKLYQTSNFIFLFIICGHILACIFIFLSHLENPSWITIQNLTDSSKLEIYISSFYYVFATVFTVGYGDIVSINIYERFYNLILLIVGIMAYSFSVSSLSNYVQNVDSRTQDYNNKMEILHHLKLSHEKMPQSLYEKISRFLKYRLTHIVRDKNEIIDNLPIGLRTTLIMEMYKPIIDNFIFFKTYNSSDFAIKVILAFRPILVMKNEKLVNEGDYLEEIIFVKRGTLSLELPLPIFIKDKDIENYDMFTKRNSVLNLEFPKTINKCLSNNKPKFIDLNNTFIPQKTMTFIRGKGLTYNNNNNNNNKFNVPIQQYVKIIEIRKNEHFGDILMFLNRRSPLSMKVKSKIAELYLLNKTDAVEISMSFPKIWGLIIKKSLFNMEQIERLINKALKFFFYQKKGKYIRGSYYQKDFSKKNIFVNCKEIYSSLSSEDCELQSIPSQVNNSDKNIMKLKSKKKNNLLNINNSYNNNESEINNSEINNKSNKSFSSNDSISKKKENNIKNIENKKKENACSENILDILNNETIKEVNSDDEKDSIFHKKNKKKTTTETENKKILGKKPLNSSSNYYSDSDSKIFDSSSSSFDNKSKTESKTKKGINENKFFDLSSFSNYNNTLLYPFSKDEINNEEYPFENNDFKDFLDKNSFSNFQGIVPKEFISNIFSNQKIKPMIINNKFIDNNQSKNYLSLNYQNNNYLNNNYHNNTNIKQIIFTNLTTSSFNFKIESIKNNILLPPKKNIFIIIKNESFSIGKYIKNCKTTFFSENNLPKLKKTFSIRKEIENNNKEEIKQIATYQRKNIINNTVKEKNISDKRISKIILNPKINNFFEKKKTELFKSDEKKNMPLFSESTLNLIGKNIESSSLALNNPKMFYTNYFNNIVQNDTNDFSSKLKNIEKIIQNGQKKNASSIDLYDINKNNNEKKSS